MFVKDERTDAFIKRFGVIWRYSNKVAWDQLIPNWRQVNLGRSRAKVEDAVLEYASREEKGKSFPPAPILWAKESGWQVLDGVQRLFAQELLGVKEFSAYLVTTDSDLLAHKIRVFANQQLNGGHCDEPQWTKRQAIQILVIDGGDSLAEVARIGGWELPGMEEDLRYLETNFKLRCAGAPEGMFKGIVLAIADQLNPDDLKKAPKPIAEFCRDLKRGRFGNGESAPYVNAFFTAERKRGNLHEQFTENLERFHKDKEVKTRLEGRAPSRRNADVKLRSVLRSVLTVTEELVAAEEEIVYLDEFFQLLNQIKTNIQKIGRMGGKK